MESNNLRQRLKDATSKIHSELDQRLDLLRNDIDVKDYRRLLARFYGYYAPLESMLRRKAPRHLELLSGRWKTAALAADLEWLGCSRAEQQRLDRAVDMPYVESDADLAGVLYVTEGATLGGAVLARHFAPRFGLSRGRGLSFFDCYGEETGEMWRRFLLWLAAFESNADCDRAVASAVRTFETLSSRLIAPQVWMPTAIRSASLLTSQ